MASQSQELMARHPWQKISSPSLGVSAFVHIIGIISFSLSYKYLVDFPSMINDSYGWHWQYLTIIGLTVAYATFVFGFLADLTLSPTLFLIKNSLSLCSTPLEVLISLLYWGISAIDKSLVVPPEIHMGPLADIGFHAIPSILLVVDLLFLSPPWTIHALPAMGLSSALAVSYWAWVEHCYKHNGFYPYPLFGQLNTTQRSILFTMAALTMTASTVMLKWLYGIVNGLQAEQRGSKPSNIKGE
ncbi:FAR-17a/AIG1-like protein [Amylocarpus encephaloides]|uniref:FAR-17a/AIG1-like protein n=1 Tax=Amylocarpus encephaloides TaxID=45428 RepID=A0A9P7YRW6_9HELO|nr:FAR-17a/AIG1-like protein [Amylocarpus encephaloides]